MEDASSIPSIRWCSALINNRNLPSRQRGCTQAALAQVNSRNWCNSLTLSGYEIATSLSKTGRTNIQGYAKRSCRWLSYTIGALHHLIDGFLSHLPNWSAPAGYGELSAEKKLIRNGEMNNNNHCLPSPVLIGQCSGHLRHYYRIKYAYFVKCYLERFVSISDPEKWTTNVAQRKKKTWKVVPNNTWHCFVNDVTKSVS